MTEEMLQRQVNEHMAHCEACQSIDGECDGPDRIEASFWNEVDRQIDDVKENRHGRTE